MCSTCLPAGLIEYHAFISILPGGHAIGNIITLRYKSVRLASPDENDGE